MRFENDGKGESNILQNRFTAYLLQAVKWRRFDYLEHRGKLAQRESLTDDEDDFCGNSSVVWPAYPVEEEGFDNDSLAAAIAALGKREAYVFFSRALEESTFQELAAELGVSYSCVTAMYYRTRRKLRRAIEVKSRGI